MNRPYPSRATSCQECQKRKKGCTREVSGCSGCRSKGIRCIYPRHTQSSELTPESRTAQNVPNTSNWNDDGLLQWDPSADAVGPIAVACPITPAFALTQAMTMLEAPILDKDDLDMALEDPDLMPTFEDFECVLTFMTTNPRAGTLMVLMNVNQFLLTFFTQPASLRLVIGAIAACYTRSAISDDTVLWFFKRARKAVILAADDLRWQLQKRTIGYLFSHGS
ncbi:hypothetical protein BCR33DRAFT_582776 [Rhizoclosmatium globosum]|uniref:Zn(2)-C6 fungal-type domain-containing protein n=1 Tax=Rhizoclosmatium globosum TaxID=329046 RepID=A0A1Y2CQX5_9FUNG|nr:hypothetical protein BCR33DRAFT_582776 [Rhizoclosmatium globosum]|eukprot:ORY49431.1 hypothetical protein BCR33DRAFT_582776 [Rhizoclosmatium globosum]